MMNDSVFLTCGGGRRPSLSTQQICGFHHTTSDEHRTCEGQTPQQRVAGLRLVQTPPPADPPSPSLPSLALPPIAPHSTRHNSEVSFQRNISPCWRTEMIVRSNVEEEERVTVQGRVLSPPERTESVLQRNADCQRLRRHDRKQTPRR
ncbi:unnamed protein product [Pleuronectes platessa]|uniref:Uncharacterized protein n=1 Tax=Pleuronectes platessa TaxID=8262 RepID=A0A9N7U510_PLEPL|nr:unnamed protein product [Pleuronectes platessa]